MAEITPLPKTISWDTAHVYLRKILYRFFHVLSFAPKGARGRILLSYVVHPLIITKKQLEASPHTNPWECLYILDILLQKGFAVDVIDWSDTTFIPKKNYSAVIDINTNLERLAPLLPSAVKIFYATGAHPAYQNSAEEKRLAELKTRRGVTLVPQRHTSPNRAIEVADYATTLGSEFAKSTFAYARKDITRIPLFVTNSYPSAEQKDFSAIRKNFVFIGGGGAVHKGLDRALEVFAQLPDYSLTICGPVTSEKDFMEAYAAEFALPSIKAVGRINVGGEQFKQIVENAAALIYPTCSEGQAGSVLVGMSAGLIPIVTREAGVEVEPFGIVLADASLENIKNALVEVSHMPQEELCSRALGTQACVAQKYMPEHFQKAYGVFIDRVIAERNL